MHRTSFLAFAVLPVLAACPAHAIQPGDSCCAAPSFDVTTVRAMQTGQRVHVQAEGIVEHTLTALDGETERIVEHVATVVAFVAEATIDAIDADGRPTDVSWLVTQCETVSDGAVTAIVPAGGTVRASWDGTRTTFRADGGELTGSAHDAFALVASLDAAHATTPGADTLRAVGESWTIDGRTAASRLAHHGAAVPDDFAATAVLVDVREHHGHRCMVLRVSIEGAGPDRPAGLPADATVESSTMIAMHQNMLPIDPAVPALADAVTIETETILVAQDDAGSPVSMRLNGRRVARIESMPAPAAAVATGAVDGQSATE